MRLGGNCSRIGSKYAGDAQIIGAGDLASAVASAVSCAAVMPSVGVVVSVSMMDATWPLAASVCKELSSAATLAAVSVMVAVVAHAVVTADCSAVLLGIAVAVVGLKVGLAAA